MDKLEFSGIILGVQPRIKLIRSFDESSHNYLGYNLFLDGLIEDHNRKYIVAIGKGTQNKFKLQAGQKIKGLCSPVKDQKNEIAEYYKVSRLQLIDSYVLENEPPPYLEQPRDLEIYRERGHRRLSARSYDTKCQFCHWACKMPVKIFVDQWDHSNIKNRFETFCYGPKCCKFYKAGPTRKVPGRKGMVWEEEDWIDEEATSHRGPDD